ncbi:MAG: NTP transferase domain-containing protein [Verrucomicrobia bacterium]|nr:MAG: NTP transferase domain-containing protein [Verrucomicrobiota bacterium]
MIQAHSMPVRQAFILGAGLGTRLRPLTLRLPKPLVPLFHRPLADWALAACAAAGIQRFAINTHHLPDAWADFGNAADGPPHPPVGANGVPTHARSWQGRELTLFHEPELLETGGGLKNIARWIGDESVLVHNGDIFSTMPLARLIAAHEASGLPVTLAIRSNGEAKHLALDASGSRCTDIRGRLGRGEGTHVFSGIYCVSPVFLDLLPADEKASVIPAFLQLAAAGLLGTIILDDAIWLDLGDRNSYLQAHRQLQLAPALHPDAIIEAGARIERSVVGPGARVCSGARLRDSVIWPGCQVAGDAVLDACVVFSNTQASGTHCAEDL